MLLEKWMKKGTMKQQHNENLLLGKSATIVETI